MSKESGINNGLTQQEEWNESCIRIIAAGDCLETHDVVCDGCADIKDTYTWCPFHCRGFNNSLTKEDPRARDLESCRAGSEYARQYLERGYKDEKGVGE
jgi:hypothetical protein